MPRLSYLPLLTLMSFGALAQHGTAGSWTADNGNGTYHNPILFADYSDPDAIRVGDDYYLVSSSFDAVPGLPILHSRDLVNWTIIGHALPRQVPEEHFAHTQHGNGVWAPSIRYHNGEFFIYYPDPDYGIYLVRSKEITGPWSAPLLVEAGKGLIDPCPLWDEDGKAFLVHAYAGSRAGVKSILVIQGMNSEGTQVLGTPVLVFDGHAHHPTVEGPKLYRRNGYYYIFAPAGGVSTGWQLVLRSKNIMGPYEERIVMDQGGSQVNGPHQGAWVTTQTGEDWFLHFQDRGAYGRVLHLQPMEWINNWPVIGAHTTSATKGEPVAAWKKPNVGKIYPVTYPGESDEFNDTRPGLQWQWQANPQTTWAMPFPAAGCLRLNAVPVPDSAKNDWDLPAILLQKFPAETFTAVTRLHFNAHAAGDRCGLIVMGMSYADISLVKKNDGVYLVYGECLHADKGRPETERILARTENMDVLLKLQVRPGGICSFSYSINGTDFIPVPDQQFIAEKGVWIGAKMGLYCSASVRSNDQGSVDVDWFRVSAGNK